MAHGLVRRESVETEMHKSEGKRKTFVYTKKRGYDVTRNPHLNKVCVETVVWVLLVVMKELDKLADTFRECRKYYNSKQSGKFQPQVSI